MKTQHGRINDVIDLYASDDLAGPCWHRSQLSAKDAIKWGEPPGRHFWVHPAIGQQPYLAVMDDFGNLVRIPH